MLAHTGALAPIHTTVKRPIDYRGRKRYSIVPKYSISKISSISCSNKWDNWVWFLGLDWRQARNTTYAESKSTLSWTEPVHYHAEAFDPVLVCTAIVSGLLDSCICAFGSFKTMGTSNLDLSTVCVIRWWSAESEGERELSVIGVPSQLLLIKWNEKKIVARWGARTLDPEVKSLMLYRLS